MSATRSMGVLAVALLLGASFSGCLSLFGAEDVPEEKDVEQKKAETLLGEKGVQQFEDIAAPTPKNFTFPGQKLLNSVTAFFNDTVGTAANTAIEGQNDRGGNDYGGVVKLFDVTPYVPAGQPTEILLKLKWNAQEGQSMDFDIVVDVPGTKTSFYGKSEEFNWNIATKTMSINTVGVAGANHLIGVQANNGRTLGGDVPFSLELQFHYAKDVLAPGVPYAFQVPANASGIIVESEKVAGDEHINSTFLVIDPNDELVQYATYNDLAVPTESYFVPVNGPGEYVFYAQKMHGGFLRLKADVPLEKLEVRQLATQLDVVADASGPAPGMVERDWLKGGAGEGILVSSQMNQQELTFDVTGAFPLEVRSWIGPGETLMSQVRVSSAKGIVHETQRVLRHTDADGNSLGYSRDEANTAWDWNKLAKGTYTVQLVNDGNVEVGHSVLTYVR